MVVMAAAAVAHGEGASRPPLESFFSGQRLQGVSISPDGRYLGLVIEAENHAYVSVVASAPRAGAAGHGAELQRSREHPMV
jgi:hypothetical protein